MENGILNSLEAADLKKRQQKAGLVVNLGLASNAVLAAIKLFAGITGHSQALLADGINSVSDVVYFIVVKVFVGLSGKPADQEHPYGHHQFESIAALVVGAFVITTGIAIFWDSVNAAFDLICGNTQPRPIAIFALGVALATILAKILLMLHARAAGLKSGNLAIIALARDHRNDIFSAAGAAIGIILSMAGLSWPDTVAGAIVAIIVTKTGFDILREASSDLMDNVPSEELALSIKKICAGISEITAVEEVHAHRFGPFLVVNLTIAVDGARSIADGHRISNSAEKKILNNIDMIRKVYIHYHPAK